MSMEGITLFKNRFIYYPQTNTLLNSETKDLYCKYAGNTAGVSFHDVPVNRETIQGNIKRLKQLIIETCRSCPVQCRYCVYGSGKYHLSRKPSSLFIDYDMAIRAIEYIYSFIRDREKKEFIIGFYGGEPLLNFPVIKKIVEYAKTKFNDWNLIFTVTTNATLLNDDIIVFLIEHNFKTLISLDGPAENHDAKRVFPDGSGTFALVMENLQKIEKANPVYYHGMVTFSIVYSKDLSLKKLYHFFNSNGLVKENFSNFGFVNEKDTNYYDYYPYDSRRLRREGRYISSRIIKKIREKKTLSHIEKNFAIEHSLIKKALDARNFTILAGTCYYDERVFLSADGRYHFCEKINDKFPIGSVEKGFDYPRMMEIINDYIGIVKKHCSICEVRCLCMRCLAHLAGDGHFRLDPGFCESARYSIKKRLEEIIQMNEAGGIP